jgi:hypothetical protein
MGRVSMNLEWKTRATLGHVADRKNRGLLWHAELVENQSFRFVRLNIEGKYRSLGTDRCDMRVLT